MNAPLPHYRLILKTDGKQTYHLAVGSEHPGLQRCNLVWPDGQYIQSRDDMAFPARIHAYLPEGTDVDRLTPLVGALKERTKRLREVWDQIDFLYAAEIPLDPALLLKQWPDPAESAM